MSSEEKKTENSNKPLDKKRKEILEIEKKVNALKPQKEFKAEAKKVEKKVAEKKEVKQEVKSTEKPKEEKVEKKQEVVKKEKKEDKKFEQVIDEKKSHNKTIWKIFLVFIIAFILLLFSTIFSIINIGKDTISKGVSIDGIDVSNLTIEEATNKLQEASNIELSLGINLKYNDDYSVDFDPNQIQYTYDVEKAVREAYNVGRDKDIFLNNYTILFTAFIGKNVETNKTYNEDSLVGIVDDVAAKIPGIVVQASYYIENDQLIIDKGQSGIQIKKDDLKNDIVSTLNARNALNILNNGQEENVEIKVENVEPDAIDIDKIYSEVYKEPKDAYYVLEPFQLFKEENGVDFAISKEEAKAIVSDATATEYTIPLKLTPANKTVDDIGTEAFPYLISTFTTKYDASNANRSGNLKIAADKINGTVLMPDEEFSFNEVVGKRTVEEGYTDAKIYENGQVVDGLAGGICQVSTTLYNACLLANLKVTERRNHSYTSSYVAAGRDATVVYGTQDFKFVNSRKYPIKLEAKVANGIVEFNIHGIREEVEYDMKVIPVTTQTIPFETEYVPDPALAPGQQVVTQAGHSGYKVTTYLEKRLGGIVVSKDIISNDTYKAMKTIVNVGQ